MHGLDFTANAVMLEAACIMYQRAPQLTKLSSAWVPKSQRRCWAAPAKRRNLGKRVRNHPAITMSHEVWRNVAAELGPPLASRHRLPSIRGCVANRTPYLRFRKIRN